MKEKTSQTTIPTHATPPRHTSRQRLVTIILVVILLLVGILAARQLMQTRPKARKKRPPRLQTLVQVQPLHPETVRITVEGMGTIIPARKIDLRSQVNGQIVTLSPSLLPGGLVKKGEELVVIDDRDYQLALAATEAGLKKSAMDLKLEEGNQAVARREYRFIQKMTDTSPEPSQEQLALRAPQLAKAKAALAMARVERDKARLNLERTRISPPFNGIVLQKNAEIGALVSSQTVVATLVGTDQFWATISLKNNSLKWLDLHPSQPLPITLTPSDAAEDQPVFYQGVLLRRLPDLEPGGLQARLLVAIDDPLSLQEKTSRPPLLLGSFVQASIPARELHNIFKLPRQALLSGNRVLLASPEKTLLIRKVRPIHQDRDWVYIREGLADGDRLITTPIAAPVEGSALRLVNTGPKNKVAGQGQHGKR